MWIRNKQIFKNHAQLPTVIDQGDTFRIFYSYRIEGKSYINYFEINKKLKIVYQNKNPVFKPGERGCFDDQGVMPSCLIGDVLYYTGWNTDKGQVPYGHGIGIAIWNESKNKFERVYLGPILDRGLNTPFLVNSPFCSCTPQGWKMWFCNGIGWDDGFPKYNICSFVSNSNKFQENYSFSQEVGEQWEACSRPFVRNEVIYFSKKIKDSSYEIYSFHNKELKKELELASIGWDSEMACYPYICGEYMFYNGNGYGATGVGVCIEN